MTNGSNSGVVNIGTSGATEKLHGGGGKGPGTMQGMVNASNGGATNASLDGGGWRVGLRHPAQPEQRLVEVTLRNEALSTSGQGTQYFEREGRRLGHVIDPRTGWPAEGLFSATVIAPTAAEADALSTALCVMGSEEAAEFCQRNQEIRALLLVPGEGGQTTCLQMNFD